MKRDWKKKFTVGLLAVSLLSGLFSGASPRAVAQETEIRDLMSDTWALEDELGRTAPGYDEVGGYNSEKKVGMFYFVWHHDLMEIAANADAEAPRNIQQIIRENPEDWTHNMGIWGPTASMHYWGEPLYGYYDLLYDEFVIRAHAQQLYNAGIDYIICDLTNFYAEGYANGSADNAATIRKICDVYTQMRAEGNPTPQISFLFTWNPTYNGKAVNHLIDQNILGNPKYEELWFQMNGKPLLLANEDSVYREYRDKFTFKAVAPQYSDAAGSWQWLATYPQGTAKNATNPKEMMAVSVAQNWTDDLQFFSATDEYGRFLARGRSWTSTNQKLLTDPTSEEYGSKYGYNFQEQFNRAIEVDPDMLFITGWNEWIAGRFAENDWAGAGLGLPNKANFADGFTSEFSRDIEMTREGDLGDNFFNQLAINIRRYKGVRNTPDFTNIKTINVNDFSSWADVPSYYFDEINDKVTRNNVKGMGKNVYHNMSGRNDFESVKVARDNDNIYMLVNTVENISPYTDSKWMRLFLKTNGDKDWNGYQYAVNIEPAKADTLTLSKCLGGWSWQKVAEIPYKVSGNQMALSIPLSAVGLSAENADFQFKWNDNMQVEGDIYEFYTSGDTAPMGRFNYQYVENRKEKDPATYTELYVEDGMVTELQLNENVSSVALRFTAVADFKGVDITAYNTFNRPASYTLKLYRFKDNYDATVSQMPVLTAKLDDVYNDSALFIGAQGIPKGEYLVVVSDIVTDAENIAGLKYYESEVPFATTYLNNVPMTGENGISLKARIHYLEQSALTASVSADGTAAPALASEDADYWSSGNAAGTEHSIVIDLGERKQVSGIRLRPCIEGGTAVMAPKSFRIEYSDDGDLYYGIARQEYQNFRFLASTQSFNFNEFVTARYIRVTLTDTEGEVRLAYAGANTFADSPKEPGEITNLGGGAAAGIAIAAAIAGAGIAIGVTVAVLKRKGRA